MCLNGLVSGCGSADEVQLIRTEDGRLLARRAKHPPRPILVTDPALEAPQGATRCEARDGADPALSCR